MWVIFASRRIQLAIWGVNLARGPVAWPQPCPGIVLRPVPWHVLASLSWLNRRRTLEHVCPGAAWTAPISWPCAARTALRWTPPALPRRPGSARSQCCGQGGASARDKRARHCSALFKRGRNTSIIVIGIVFFLNGVLRWEFRNFRIF